MAIKWGDDMIDKTHIVKNNKIILYITYTILLAFVVFNYEIVLSTLAYIFKLATPLYIALVIAFLLNIPMKKLEVLYGKKIKKDGLKRGLAIATTLLFALSFIILFSSFIIPRLIESVTLIISNIFNYSNRLVHMINNTFSKFHINYALNYDTISKSIMNLGITNLLSTDSGSPGLAILFQSFGLFSVFINAITSFIMSIYLLANKETHIRQMKKMITFIFGYKKALNIFDIGIEANHYFNGFVSGQLLECCILMIIMYLGFKLTNMPFPELLAFIIGFTALVPMFGGFVGFGICFILILAVQTDKAILFTICFLIIQQIESNIIYPRVVGNAVGISGLYVLIALVIFGNLWGLLGMLIAVPCMALIYAVTSRTVNISLYRKHIEVTDKTIQMFEDE